MTNIIFSRKEFEKHLKLNSEIESKITLFGTPLEKIDKDSVEIEVFANRPDLISLDGFMRSFKRFLGKDSSAKNYSLKKAEAEYKVLVDSSVKNVRPYIMCAVVKKVDLDDEKLKDLINLQEKLATTIGRNRKKVAIGVYPLDKVKFPVTYTALNPKEIRFTPLGNKNELASDEILEASPVGRKYSSLLKDFKKYPVFIDNKNNILSMPPIINSELSGRVDLGTKELFIECTGTDKIAVERTLIIMATSLAESGCAIYQVDIVDDSVTRNIKLENQKTKISIDNVNKLLGLELSESQIQKLLEKMGHSYKKGIVESPCWRFDILHEVDLIEDIAIAYGYNNLVPEVPNISTAGEESRQNIVKRKLSEILIGLGLLEISTYHLIKPEEVEKHGLKDSLELLDSKNEYKYLRPNLFVPMLRVLSENKDSEYPQKFFEIGRVFNKNMHKENDIEENDSLIIGLSPANATEIKKRLDYFFKMIDVEYKISELDKNDFIDGRTCSILVNNNVVGYFGEVHPNTLKDNGLIMPFAVAEINIDEIYSLIN